jgi:TusA-related sulfurtransferase
MRVTDPGVLNLETLGFERGAHLLVQQTLRNLRPGDELGVTGSDPAVIVHLEAWCRQNGHRVRQALDTDFGVRAWVARGRADLDRWADAQRSRSQAEWHRERPCAGLGAWPPAGLSLKVVVPPHLSTSPIATGYGLK